MDASKHEEWPDMIEDCQQRESKLSDWERSFIDSIEQQLARGGTLTEKQREQLDCIWEKVT